jgi:hypothetical protein
MQLSATFGSPKTMRFFKIVLTAFIAAIAVLAGLFIAAAAAITSLVLSFFSGSRRQSGSARTSASPHSAGVHRTKARDPDAIDVTATEVPLDPAGR